MDENDWPFGELDTGVLNRPSDLSIEQKIFITTAIKAGRYKAAAIGERLKFNKSTIRSFINRNKKGAFNLNPYPTPTPSRTLTLLTLTLTPTLSLLVVTPTLTLTLTLTLEP
jgi:hypothetical protein